MIENCEPGEEDFPDACSTVLIFGQRFLTSQLVLSSRVQVGSIPPFLC